MNENKRHLTAKALRRKGFCPPLEGTYPVGTVEMTEKEADQKYIALIERQCSGMTSIPDDGGYIKGRYWMAVLALYFENKINFIRDYEPDFIKFNLTNPIL